MSLPFLLEIGAEEIPDWMIPGALANLQTLFEETLSKAGVSTQSVRVDATPRRLTLRAEGLPDVILKIYFPKTMYWTARIGPRFIRPIRWIVALLGDEVVPFELAGVRPGKVSRGHRILGQSAVPVTHESYERVLCENFVILSAAERREK